MLNSIIKLPLHHLNHLCMIDVFAINSSISKLLILLPYKHGLFFIIPASCFRNVVHDQNLSCVIILFRPSDMTVLLHCQETFFCSAPPVCYTNWLINCAWWCVMPVKFQQLWFVTYLPNLLMGFHYCSHNLLLCRCSHHLPH